MESPQNIKKQNNFAYIDGANLHKGNKSLGWKLDYNRFKVWLSEKYGVKTAYIFLGLVPKYKELYKYLQECGFVLIFKQVNYTDDGTVKGNCDAILVLNAVSDFYEKKFDRIVVVSSDGDYAELVEFLNNKKSLLSVVSPSNKCSYLLRRQNIPLLYLDTQKNKLERE
jgi:uncharacterized LabA/DUF88 family protein